MVLGNDFPRKTPKYAAWRSIRIEGIGARGRFLTQKPENWQESIKYISKTNGFELQFFNSSRSRVKIPTFW